MKTAALLLISAVSAERTCLEAAPKSFLQQRRRQEPEGGNTTTTTDASAAAGGKDGRSYVGCFALPAGGEKQVNPPGPSKMSVRLCHSLCRKSAEAEFFWLSQGRDCYCGANAPVLVPKGVCTQICAGDDRDICGSAGVEASVYHLSSCGKDAVAERDEFVAETQNQISQQRETIEGIKMFKDALLASIDKITVTELRNGIKLELGDIVDGCDQCCMGLDAVDKAVADLTAAEEDHQIEDLTTTVITLRGEARNSCSKLGDIKDKKCGATMMRKYAFDVEETAAFVPPAEDVNPCPDIKQFESWSTDARKKWSMPSPAVYESMQAVHTNLTAAGGYFFVGDVKSTYYGANEDFPVAQACYKAMGVENAIAANVVTFGEGEFSGGVCILYNSIDSVHWMRSDGVTVFGYSPEHRLDSLTGNPDKNPVWDFSAFV